MILVRTTLVNCTCRSCGQVQMTSSDIELFVCDNDKNRNHYAFTCPLCGDRMRWFASDSDISKLRGIGIPVQRVHVPLEVLETRATGRPLTYDDILDIMLELDTWTGEIS